MRVTSIATLGRIVIALVLAALAAAALGAALLYSVRVLPFVFLAALLHAILIGLPAYLLLRRFGRPSWFACIVAGFLIGAVPFAVVTFRPGFLLSISGSVATVLNGVRTSAGWHDYIQAVCAFGTFGAAAGYVFWLALRVMGDEDQIRRALHPALGALAAAIASIGILSVPPHIEDRTCHNPRRGLQQALQPAATAVIRIEPGDWPRIVAIFAEFATERGWSVRVPATREGASVSVCDEAGTQIMAIDPGRPVADIQVYQPQGGAGWQDPARALVTRLSLALPGRVGFQNQAGKEVASPAWFEAR